ncbi:hypothetical protein F4805DRAFT_458752 [Annulohypoxylon moriforme]|nr:hypothetical protein F4805DRAFT_458752 [Annulohypoxylon moriforme]
MSEKKFNLARLLRLNRFFSSSPQGSVVENDASPESADNKKRRSSVSSTVSSSSSAFSLHTVDSNHLQGLESFGRLDRKETKAETKQNGANNVEFTHFKGFLASRPFSVGKRVRIQLLVPKCTSDETTSPQQQHGAQNPEPSKDVTDRISPGPTPDVTKGAPSKTQSPLVKLQEQMRRVRAEEEENIPRWKAKAAQKRNKQPRATEKPYFPMSQAEYHQFWSGLHPASPKDPGKSNIKPQDTSAAEEIEKPTVSKRKRARKAKKKKPNPGKSELESAEQPKLTAQVETEVVGTTTEKSTKDAPGNSSKAKDAASAGPPSSTTVPAEETIDRSKITPECLWEQLVTTAVGALQAENNSPATEATTQSAETIRPDTIPAIEDTLSQGNNTQDTSPPSDEKHGSTPRNVEPKKETNETAGTKLMIPDSHKKSNAGLNAEEAKREKNMKKNMKKKERKKKAAAAAWEKKTKLEQAKQELKETRKREHEEAEHKKAQKAKEIEEAKKANMLKLIQSNPGGDIEEPTHSQGLRDGIQKLVATQETNSNVENVRDIIEIQEHDHDQRTEQWIKQTSLHGGHTKPNEYPIPGEEDNQETKSRDYGGNHDGSDNKEEFKQADSLPENRGRSLNRTDPEEKPKSSPPCTLPLESDSDVGNLKYPYPQSQFSTSSPRVVSLPSSIQHSHETSDDTKVLEESSPTEHHMSEPECFLFHIPTIRLKAFLARTRAKTI